MFRITSNRLRDDASEYSDYGRANKVWLLLVVLGSCILLVLAMTLIQGLPSQIETDETGDTSPEKGVSSVGEYVSKTDFEALGINNTYHNPSLVSISKSEMEEDCVLGTYSPCLFNISSGDRVELVADGMEYVYKVRATFSSLRGNFATPADSTDSQLMLIEYTKAPFHKDKLTAVADFIGCKLNINKEDY